MGRWWWDSPRERSIPRMSATIVGRPRPRRATASWRRPATTGLWCSTSSRHFRRRPVLASPGSPSVWITSKARDSPTVPVRRAVIFELPDGAWPGPGSGTAVTWASAQTGHLVEVYWFAMYSYDSYGPGDFCLIANPIQGGNFADDDTPSNVDPVAAFGCFGFHGGDALVPCPAVEAAEACCFDDGSCELLLAGDCESAGGAPGFGPACNPNPCPQPGMGACCIDSDCTLLTEDDCVALGGQYAGDGTTCDEVDCGAIPTRHGHVGPRQGTTSLGHWRTRLGGSPGIRHPRTGGARRRGRLTRFLLACCQTAG